MRFHVAALPHTRTSKEFTACAYTQKVLNFCKMMRSLGHEVFHYGAEGSEADSTEHVTVITRAEQEQFFGGYDWRGETFRLEWDPAQPYWQLANFRTAAEILSRKQRGDFLCLIGGVCHKPIADIVTEQDVIAVEYGVGYYGVFSRFRVFESYTHQAAVYGMLSGDPNGHLYDAVIPNYFDPADFPAGPGGDYLLFLSRINHRKGIQIAIDTAQAAGMRLVVAGQRGDFWPLPDWVEYAGYADVAKRAALMGGARALLLPTLYMEPFGGAAVEAQLTGTPPITTDHAAFSETVIHGATGFRCHTLAQFVEAAKQAGQLDRAAIRQSAIARYSLDRVSRMYQTYFSMLQSLWREGWPELGPEAVSDLGWLNHDSSALCAGVH